MNKLNYLCTFTDDSQTKIASLKTFLPGQEISEQDYIVLPEDDERVQACLNPSEEKYVQRIIIKTLEDLYRLADLYDRASPKPLYRGQSDYSWKLETPLERNRSEFIKRDMGLEIYEHYTLDESQRRFHEFFTQLPGKEDRLSWLALMRHRGIPTRLLDVTRSLYIACYFALRDKKDEDAAIWIFSTVGIDSSVIFHRWSRIDTEDLFRKSSITHFQQDEPIRFAFPHTPLAQSSVPTLETLKHPDFHDSLHFPATLDAAMRGYINRPGVARVEPFWLSRRNDFQQGAFLVPFNVRLNFEENLFFYLDMSERETEERNVPEDREELIKIWHSKVIKLRIPKSLHSILRVKLEAMNIRELTLFPDIDGAISHLTTLVPRQN